MEARGMHVDATLMRSYLHLDAKLMRSVKPARYKKRLLKNETVYIYIYT